MEEAPGKIESRFLGHKFTPGDKVKLADIERYEYDKDPFFKGVDLYGTFTVKAVETEHRPDTGEHDEIGAYDYQTVELAEIPFKAANDRFVPVDQSSDK